MINPIILNKNGVSRFTDFVSLFPPILRQEPDVVEFLNLMSDYINNAYRDTQSVKKYSMQVVTTETQLVSTINKLESFRELLLGAKNNQQPVLYITDSDIDSVNPLYVNKTVKMLLRQDTTSITFVYPSDTSKNINEGDSVIGTGIPDDTIVINKSGNSVLLNNTIELNGEEFITFANPNNNFDDVVSFSVGKVGDIHQTTVKRDVSEGIQYLKVYFTVEIRNIIGDIEDIDFRYDLSGYSDFDVQKLDNVIQAGDIKFRNESPAPIYISNALHKIYKTGTGDLNNYLSIDGSELSDITTGYRVESSNLPTGTYVISKDSSGVYLSNNINKNGIVDVYFYPDNYILPSDSTISMLPPEGLGRFVKNISLDSSDIAQAVTFDYLATGNNIISIQNYEVVYNASSGELSSSKNLEGIYFSGETIDLLLTRENGSKSLIQMTIDRIEYDGSSTTISFERDFSVDITSNDTLEILTKFSSLYSIDDSVQIDNTNYRINKIIEYDIGENIIDESISGLYKITHVDLELDNDVVSSGQFSVYNYKLIIQTFDMDPSDGDYIELNISSVPSGITVDILNSDDNNSILAVLDSSIHDEFPYRFEYTDDSLPWKYINETESLSSEYIHSIPPGSTELTLSDSNVRKNDQLIIHTDMQRALNSILPIANINTVADTLDIKKQVSENSIITFIGTEALPSPLQSNVDYYVINPSGTIVQLSSTKSGSAIDITGTGTIAHPIQIKNEVTYLDHSGSTLLNIKSKDKRKSYKNVYTYNGANWVLTNSDQTFRDGSGIFYSRAMTSINVPDKYLDSFGNPIFQDSITEINESEWRGKFTLGRSYNQGNVVGLSNGEMYLALETISNSSIFPNMDKENWKLIDNSIYVNNKIFGTNPYIYGPLQTKTMSNSDVLKSNYSLDVSDSGKVALISGDVRNVLAAGDTVTILYYQLGNLIEQHFQIDSTVYYANNSTTEISISNENDYTEISTDIDINNNTIEVSNSDNWSYGQRIRISSTGTLPLPLESSSIYYILSSGEKPGDSTKKLITLSDEFGTESEVSILSTGTGNISVTAEYAIPPNATSSYLELNEISDTFFISKEKEQVFDISTAQRSWLFNPRSAPTSSYTRNGWLTTINNLFSTSTVEFYCRRNLFNAEEVELGYYTDGTGISRPAWYKYTIDELEKMTNTDYSSSGAGYDSKLVYVNNRVYNKIQIAQDVTTKYSSDRDSVSNFVKIQIDGSETKQLPILSIEELNDVTTIEFGNSSLLPSAFNVSDDTIEIGNEIENGIEVSFYGFDLPSPLIEGDVYYIINSNSKNVQLSDTLNGNVIDITDQGTGTFYCKYNVVSPRIVNINSASGSKVISVNGVVDITQYSTGDYIIAKNSVLGNIFPDDTKIVSINSSTGSITVNKSAIATATSDIAVISSTEGRLYYVDKTYMRIKQLTIDTDPSKLEDDNLDDNEKYALYANPQISRNIPGDIYSLPLNPLIIVSGVADDEDGLYSDFDVIESANEELIDSFFEFEHIDNIDTTNYPPLEYDYRRDDNTHILAKDAHGDYIHKNVNINKDFVGISDQKYSFAEKIERLAYQKDPNVIDIDLIEYLARFMGYDITVLKDDLDSSPIHDTDDEREMALRKTIQNLPEYHAIKSTTTGLQALLLTFGVVGRIINLWSVKSDPYLGRWFSDDEVPFFIRNNVGGNKVLDPTIKKKDGGPSELVPTPHFKLTVNVEPENEDIAPTNVDLSRVKLAITRNKPINTVFDGIISQIKMAHSEFISRPAMKNKVKMSMSVGFDDNETVGIIDSFNECNCP